MSHFYYLKVLRISPLAKTRARTGRIEWEEIAMLYEGLTRLSPTLGILVGKAAAVAEAYGTEKGLALLEAIPQAKIVNYQPYWALAAHLYTNIGKIAEAQTAYSRAIGLCEDHTVKQFLHQRAKEGVARHGQKGNDSLNV